MTRRFCVALACGLALAGSAAAQSPSLIEDKFTVSLGGYLMQTDLTARLDGSSTRNPEIDFDNSFGLGDDTSRVRLDGLWRITPSHHLRFMYFNNKKSRNRVLSEDIRWGDNVYQAGANVSSELKFSIYQLAYEYAFLHNPNYELAGTIGVHYLDLQLKLAGTATITDSNGNVVSRSFQSRSGDLPAPLPVIGLRGMWRVTPAIFLDAQGQFFKVKVDDLDGTIYDLRAGGTYMFTRNFGVGLGYNWFNTRVDASRSAFNGRVDIGYSGLMLYATASF